MRFLRWIDRNHWSIPVLVFLLAGLGLSIWSAASSRPVLLAADPLAIRESVYSSLAATSCTFFGIAVAVVTILVAFGSRPDPSAQAIRTERNMAHARTIVIGSLLVVSFFMLVIVIAATLGLAIDSRRAGNGVITTLIEASGVAGVVGLLVGGIGMALVIVERARQ